MTRDCNLECANDNQNYDDGVVEFVGPVKIILVDQKKQSYKFKVCYAAFVVLAQMTIATTCLIVLFYSLTYTKKTFMKALHIFLCTIGFQLLLPVGVLTVNSDAALMTQSDRMFEHGIVQTFGLGVTIAGSAVSFFAKYPNFYTTHCMFGLVANCFGILGAFLGICVYVLYKVGYINTFKRILLGIHKLCGVLTITLSSTCFVLGIMSDSFNEWLPLEEMFYCLVIFCVFYTCVVIYKPLQF